MKRLSLTRETLIKAAEIKAAVLSALTGCLVITGFFALPASWDDLLLQDPS